MGNLSRAFLNVPESDAAEPHPSDEDLACLAEGILEPAERKSVLAHVLTCSRCYQAWNMLLTSLEQAEEGVVEDGVKIAAVAAAPAAAAPAAAARPTPSNVYQLSDKRVTFWARHQVQILALAACLLLFVTAGVTGRQLGWFGAGGEGTGPLTVSVLIDAPLQDLLAEAQAGGGWQTGGRLGRLTQLLHAKGINIGQLTNALLLNPYMPSKELLSPPEELRITVRNGVATLEVVEQKPKP